MSAYLYGLPAGAIVTGATGNFHALTMTVTGWDDSVWDLTNPDTGVLLTSDGLIGLLNAPIARFATASPSVAGSRYRDSRTLERPVTWPVHIYSDQSSQAWIDLDRAFHKILRRDQTLTWTVTQAASGQTRSLVARFVGETPAITIDPTSAGWASTEVQLVAEDPYWRGRPIHREFGTTGTDPFIPDGGGPPFTISEGSTISSGAIVNPGDVIAWPVWTITGPTTEVTVGIGDSIIGIYGDLDADDVLVIDTDPRRQSATLNGVRERGILAPHDFAPIPAGGRSILSMSIVGTGKVAIEIVPRYERAW